MLIGSLDRLREALNLKMTFALLCCAIGEVLKAQVPLSPRAEQLALAMFDGKIEGDKLDWREMGALAAPRRQLVRIQELAPVFRFHPAIVVVITNV